MLADNRFKPLPGNVACYSRFPVYDDRWGYREAGCVIFVRMVVIKRFGYSLDIDAILFAQTGHHLDVMFSGPPERFVEIEDYFDFFAFFAFTGIHFSPPFCIDSDPISRLKTP